MPQLVHFLAFCHKTVGPVLEIPWCCMKMKIDVSWIGDIFLHEWNCFQDCSTKLLLFFVVVVFTADTVNWSKPSTAQTLSTARCRTHHWVTEDWSCAPRICPCRHVGPVGSNKQQHNHLSLELDKTIYTYEYYNWTPWFKKGSSKFAIY